MDYIVTRECKFRGLDGTVRALRPGKHCTRNGNFLYCQGRPLCAIHSQNAFDYLARDDDHQGMRRGRLTHEIINLLGKQDAQHQERWDRIWGTPEFHRFRRPEYEDHWLWNYNFYEADIEDLEKILHTALGG